MSGTQPEQEPQNLFDRWSPDALSAIGRLDFIAREVLDGVQQGLHRSVRRGFSSEFFDYKNYQEGDDAAKIDWRLFAKTGKFYVKRFEAETSLECMILTDLSPSMRWKWEQTVSKLEYTAMLAASLALLFCAQRDLVGLHSFGALPQKHLPPKGSSKQAEQFISLLGQPIRQDPAVKSGSADGPSLLETARAMHSILPHRGLIILFSDFEFQEKEIRESISLLRAKGDELVLFHLLDIAEINLPFQDATHIQDSETHELIPISPRDLRDLHVRRIQEFRALVKQAAEAVGAVYVPIDTSLSPVDSILRMNSIRKEGLA